MPRRSLLVCTLLLSTAQAANIDGSIDVGYGEQPGRTQVGFADADPRPGGMAVSAQGSLWMFGADRDDPTHLLVTRHLAASGLLNTSFGANNDGRQRVTLPTGYRDPIVNGAAVQADGKPLAFGHLQESNGSGGYGAFVCRFNVAGNLDTSFSGDGCQIFFSNVDNSETCEVEDVAFDASNRVLTVGVCRRLGQNHDEYRFLARLGTNGAFDTAFADGGNLILPPLLAGDTRSIQNSPAVTVTPDGRILTLSTVRREAPSGNDIIVARYEDDGDVDLTFGAGGRFVLPLDSEVSNYQLATDFTLLPDGRLLVLGESSFDNTYAVLVRLLPNGSGLDPEFGNGGVIYDYVQHNIFAAERLLVDDLGRPIALSRGTDAQADQCHWITRFTRSGQRDTSFASDGQLCLRMSTAFGTPDNINVFETTGMHIDRNGLVIATHAHQSPELINSFLVYRLAAGELFRDGFD